MNTAYQCPCVIEIARKKKIEKLTEFANIPKEFQELKINDFRTDIYKDIQTIATTKQIAVNYVKEFQKAMEMGKGLYFYSKTPGSGKTRLAISIGNAILNLYNKSVKYMTVDDLLSEIQASFNNKQINQQELKQAAKEVDFLILDDLAVENNKPWSESVVYSILDYRNENKKTTIFTSNLSIDDLPYQERIKSRIRRMTMTVKFPEESVREKMGEDENNEFINLMMK